MHNYFHWYYYLLLLKLHIKFTMDFIKILVGISFSVILDTFKLFELVSYKYKY